MVYAEVEFIHRVLQAGREIEGPAAGVGQRVERQEERGLRRQPVRRDDIAGEGLPGQRILIGALSAEKLP